MTSTEPSPEERLATALNNVIDTLDPRTRKERMRQLSEAFMAPLTRAEKKAAKNKAMQEIMAGMLAEAAGTTDQAAGAIDDLMGGIQGLMGSILGAAPTSTDDRVDDSVQTDDEDDKDAEDDRDSEDIEVTEGADEGELDLSAMVEALVGNVDGLNEQLSSLMGPMMAIALKEMDRDRARKVAREWAGQLESILGRPESDGWNRLIEDLISGLGIKAR